MLSNYLGISLSTFDYVPIFCMCHSARLSDLITMPLAYRRPADVKNNKAYLGHLMFFIRQSVERFEGLLKVKVQCILMIYLVKTEALYLL